MPFFMKPIARTIASHAKSSFIEPQIKVHLDYVEAELGKSAWFVGNELSAADVQMSFPLEAAAARAGLDASVPEAHRVSRAHPRAAGIRPRARERRPLRTDALSSRAEAHAASSAVRTRR